MNICSDDHDEIVFIGKASSCPLCEAITEKAELVIDIEKLEQEIEELKDK